MNQRTGDLGRLWRDTRPQKRRPQCISKGCLARSSLNHLLKKRGVLSTISRNGHVHELKTDRFRDARDNRYYAFERVGWDHALAMYGYCGACDQALFAPIEVPNVRIPICVSDFCRYALRPTVHELRKKEGNIGFTQVRDGMVWYKDTLGISYLRCLLACFTEGLSGAAPVTFAVRELPKLDICASSILIRPRHLRGRTPVEAWQKLADIDGSSFNIVNLFPTDDALVLIVGTHDRADNRSHELITSVVKAPDLELTRIVSNILIGQVEDWAISETLYERLPEFFENTINRAKFGGRSYDADVGIDLFQL